MSDLAQIAGIDMDDPAVGFPWERLDAARRYLYLVSPWWSRYGNHFKVIPVNAQTLDPDHQPYGLAITTDEAHRLYVDRTFAINAPLHIVTAYYWRAILHHVRDHWSRLSWIEPELWAKWAPIAYSLEINSTIDQETAELTLEDLQQRARSSVFFSVGDFQRWSVTSPPRIPEDAWLPRTLGLPDGLSAERYYDLIVTPPPPPEEEPPPHEKDQEDQEQQDQEQDQSQPDSDEQDDPEEGDSTDGSSGSSSQSDEQQSDDDSDGASEGPSGAFQSPSDDQESVSDDQDATDDAPDGSQGGQGEKEEGQPSEDDTVEGTPDKGGEGKPDPDNKESGADPTEGQPQESSEGGEQSQGGQRQQKNADAEAEQESDSASEGDDQQEGQQDSKPNERPADLDQRIEEMRSQGMAAAELGELSNPNDEFSVPNWKPKKVPDPPSTGEVAAAERALAQDIEEARNSGVLPMSESSDILMEWSDDYQESHHLKWEQHFARLLSSSVQSAKIKGQGDLSYSVRNPNQPALGVVMMGMHDYAPKVYLMMDVSPSMRTNARMSGAMSTFAGLAKANLGRYGEQLTWISADTKITDVDRTCRWDEKMRERLSYTSGGTSLGNLIVQVMQHGFRFGRRTYPRPDLLVVATDCIFTWPKTRPRTAAKLLVVDVDPSGKSSKWLPEWVNHKTEYVAVYGDKWA